MDARYTCLDCDWPPSDDQAGDEAAALSHFVETGHSIEAVSLARPRQGWRRRLEAVFSWR